MTPYTSIEYAKMPGQHGVVAVYHAHEPWFRVHHDIEAVGQYDMV